jgi:5-methylcytosine-specific restriction endonuclease McrA
MREDSTPAHVSIVCETCGKTRDVPRSQYKRVRARFCSTACFGESLRKFKTCAHCGETFSGDSRRTYCSKACSYAARRIDGARWKDPDQIKAYMREYRKATKEQHNLRNAKWAKANRDKRNANQRKRRDIGHGKGFIGRVRRELIERYGEVCLRCGSTDHVQVDHVIPVALGGPNVIENMQLLCRSCNVAKSDTIADYRHAVYGVLVQEVTA